MPPLHTHFKLKSGGEYLALVRPDGTIAQEFSPAYPALEADQSYGRGSLESGSEYRVFDEPSPWESNVPEPPTIVCAGDVTVEASADCNWRGELEEPFVTDPDARVDEIVLERDAPRFFLLGTTEVIWTATDRDENSVSCSQFVTVVDATPPTPVCPEGLSVVCDSAAGAVVTFEATATDGGCGGDVSEIVCEPASGNVFPVGATTVTCTAIDATGNSAQCSFQVEVRCGGFVRPGDCNGDGAVDLSDAVCLLSVLFLGTERRLPCGDGTIRDPANVALMSWRGTDDVDLSAAVALLTWKFLGGPTHVLGPGCVPLQDCPDVCEPGESP